MILQILLGGVMAFCTLVFHMWGLVLIGFRVSRSPPETDAGIWPIKSVRFLSITGLGMMLLHLAEALIWALLFLGLGEFSSLQTALYFSVTTQTTLGYGDLTLSGEWQLLSAFQAISGLIIYGATTAAFFQLMKQVLRDPMAKT